MRPQNSEEQGHIDFLFASTPGLLSQIHGSVTDNIHVSTLITKLQAFTSVYSHSTSVFRELWGSENLFRFLKQLTWNMCNLKQIKYSISLWISVSLMLSLYIYIVGKQCDSM